MLLGGLGSYGLWEPSERQLADKLDQPSHPEAFPPHAADGCLKQAPKDADARSLETRAIELGKDISDSDGGRRLPFALLGLLTVLATAGIAMRTVGPRAGVITALVLLAMPLLALQSRQIDSEIGTATGAALSIYGLVALRRAGELWHALPLGLARPRRSPIIAIVDATVGVLALAAGIAIGFLDGGALLGVAAPLGAFAAAGALGIPTVADSVRGVHNAIVSAAARLRPRWAIGRSLWPYRREDNWPALLATLLAAIAIAALVYQMFALRDPQPGLVPPQREVLGHAIVAPGCWSPALGGMWRSEDDVRVIYDSAFEQIAYGTFPWGLLAPLAFVSLLALEGRRRAVGVLALAWASAAWLATELFARKVGFAVYAGFPAIALALGAWLDGLLDRETPKLAKGGALLVGAFTVLATIDVAKDLQSFTERLTSLQVGGGSIAYPTESHLLFVPTRLWLLVLGAIFAFGFAVALAFATGETPRRKLAARIGALATAAVTVVFAAFWSYGWLPALSTNLSSKTMFETVRELAKPGDQLVIMGDLGGAPHDYLPTMKPETAPGRPQIVAALQRPNRVFAIVPESNELCSLFHEMGGKPYYVIDDRNVHSYLMSNKLDGTTDKNPLRTMMLRTEPPHIAHRPKGRVVWDNKIELLGWDIPSTVSRGSRFDVTMYYKILAPPGGAYTTLFHFDAPYGRAFNGDHVPLDNKCATSTWQAGDYVVDTYEVTAGYTTTPKGPVDVWTGFFTGSTGNYKNMPLSEAPSAMRDPNPETPRLKITTIVLD